MFYASPGFGTMAQAQSTNSAAPESQQILIRMGDETVTATLIDSEATRDFVAMLPLSVRVNDHMRREKTGDLPGPLSENTERVRTYKIGDVAYWPPTEHFVIYYEHDGLSLPSPGIVVLGKIASGVEMFDVPGSVDVTVELID